MKVRVRNIHFCTMSGRNIFLYDVRVRSISLFFRKSTKYFQVFWKKRGYETKSCYWFWKIWGCEPFCWSLFWGYETSEKMLGGGMKHLGIENSKQPNRRCSVKNELPLILSFFIKTWLFLKDFSVKILALTYIMS